MTGGRVGVTGLEGWRPRDHCPRVWGDCFWYLRRKADGAHWTTETFDTKQDALAYAALRFPGVEVEVRLLVR